MKDTPFEPDQRLLRRSFDRAVSTYDAAAVLQREVGERMLERLDLVRLEPRWILDVGAGTGVPTRALQKRYPNARIVALDLAPAMLRRARRRAPLLKPLRAVCADAAALPFAAGSFDLVFSNLALQWCPDLDRVFSGLQRVLRPEGLLMFSSLGPDTLTELRQSWAGVDDRSHVNAFIDMHDIGDALVRESLADPVLDTERITMTYESVDALMQDLKALGAHNVTVGRARGLTGKGRLQTMVRAYERFRDADGRLPATYEVVYGHAWAPRELPQRSDADGTVRVPLSSLKRR